MATFLRCMVWAVLFYVLYIKVFSGPQFKDVKLTIPRFYARVHKKNKLLETNFNFLHNNLINN